MSPQEFLDALWLAFGAVVGACLGSFANVVISRVPRGESVVHPPSRCPACGTPIRPWQNIPVASWIALRGRARCCGAPISAQYVLVEAIGGLLGWSVVLVHGAGPGAIFFGLVLWTLLCVAVIDWRHWFIPRGLSLGLIPLGFVGNAAMVLSVGGSWPTALRGALMLSGLGALVGFGMIAVLLLSFTWLFRATGRLGPDEEAMGWGDAHLLAGIGACLGVSALPWVVALASFTGTVVGGAVVLRHRVRVARGEVTEQAPEPTGNPDDDEWRPPEGAVQFGPFLAAGAGIDVLGMHYLPSLDVVAVIQGLLSS